MSFPSEPFDQRREALVEAVAREIRLRGLTGPAVHFLEASRPYRPLGAPAMLFFDPVFGRISDRTMSRFGRRRPWMIVGMAGLLVALLIMAIAPTALVVGAGWILAQITANAAIAAHTASIADQLPSSQRGKVAGAIGIAHSARAKERSAPVLTTGGSSGKRPGLGS